MTPETLVIERLKGRKTTLAVAESCTGGLLAARITDVSGASEVFLGGVVAYSNEVKERLLHVRAETLAQFGAVSEPVAIEMAAGAQLATGSNFGVGITGVAGPGGGTEEKPVGLVYIAVAGPEEGFVTRNHFPGDRAAVRAQSVDKALEMLLELLADG